MYLNLFFTVASNDDIESFSTSSDDGMYYNIITSYSYWKLHHVFVLIQIQIVVLIHVWLMSVIWSMSNGLPVMNVNSGSTNIVVGYWKKLIQSVLAVGNTVSVVSWLQDKILIDHADFLNTRLLYS